MERLTYRPKEPYISRSSGDLIEAYSDADIREIINRLADLEDIYSYARLRELAEADREGRVVVLPCKVGDTVYVSYGEGYRPCIVDRIHVLSKNEAQIRARYLATETLLISASEFGKTVFLTREEAEEALRRG